MKDIIKNSVLQHFSDSDITFSTVMVSLAIACMIGVYIFIVYYISTKKTFYQRSFNIALAVLVLITTSIILAMQTNLAISLGMVGALSIVRFRTAVKDPMDLIFLFWSISMGVVCGAGIFEIAFSASLLITVMLMLLELTPFGRVSKLLVLNIKGVVAEKIVMETVRKHCTPANIKSRNISENAMDIVIECKVKEERLLIEELSMLKEINSFSLIKQDGEATF